MDKNTYSLVPLTRAITISESQEDHNVYIATYLNYIENTEDFEYLYQYCINLTNGISDPTVIVLIGEHAASLLNSIMLSDIHKISPSIFSINTYNMNREEYRQYVERALYDIKSISPDRNLKLIYINV